jgi:hypothetical protein
MLLSYAVRWTTKPNEKIDSYEDYTDEDRDHIIIRRNTLYRHKKLNIKYHTYDMQEDEDIIYTKNHPGIMVHSPDAGHPYLYGRVLDLFHIEVKNNGPNALLPDSDAGRLDMVWVHWYDLDQPHEPSGFRSLRYPSISLCKNTDPYAHGLVHPDEIVRRVHLIPNFKMLVPGMKEYERVQVDMYVAIPFSSLATH